MLKLKININYVQKYLNTPKNKYKLINFRVHNSLMNRHLHKTR